MFYFKQDMKKKKKVIMYMIVEYIYTCIFDDLQLLLKCFSGGDSGFFFLFFCIKLLLWC